MRSLVLGFLGLTASLSIGFTAFGATVIGLSDDATRGREVLREINQITSTGLNQVENYKYKIGGLCKFVGQLIVRSEEAQELSTKLQGQKDYEVLAKKLNKSRAILYVAQVDTCTAIRDYGQPGPDPLTEANDGDTLEQSLRNLVNISSIQ